MATIEILSADQALANLSNHKLGRIVMHSRDGLEIFPINYVTDRINLYFCLLYTSPSPRDRG